MKRIIPALVLCIIMAGSVCSYGQSTLLFTSEYEGANYPLDSIIIKNISNGSKVVKYYPDTVLNLATTNIPNIEGQETYDLRVNQNYPNPFSGRTRFEIEAAHDETVFIKVVNGSGRVLLSQKTSLQAGKSYFEFTGGGNQLLYLTVQAGNFTTAIRMISIGRDSDKPPALIYSGTDPATRGFTQEKNDPAGTKGGLEYTPGDSLVFTGYITRGTRLVLSDTIADRPSDSRSYSFNFRKTNRVVILMYHDLVDGEPEDIYERKVADFENDLNYLKDNFQILSMEDMLLIRSGAKELIGDGVVITFDDGYSSVHSKAFPLMSSRDMPATFFLVAEWVDAANYITWPQVSIMSGYKNSAGKRLFSMGSHTSSHPFLEQSRQLFATYEEYIDFLDVELGDSREWIVDVTGQDTIFLSLPFGDGAYNADIIEAAVRNGYFGIRTSVWNSFSINEMNIFALPSIPILSDTPIEFIREFFDL